MTQTRFEAIRREMAQLNDAAVADGTFPSLVSPTYFEDLPSAQYFAALSAEEQAEYSAMLDAALIAEGL